MNEYHLKGYTFRSVHDLSVDHLEEILQMIALPAQAGKSRLGGRQSVISCSLSGLGSVVLKTYRRGGFFGRCNTRYYLKMGKTRSEHEFEFMQEARSNAISVPEPLIAIHHGGLFYRAWLISREVPGEKTLADLGFEEPDMLDQVISDTAMEIHKLIEARICHVDLHPGNVLVDPAFHCFLVDFDKAFFYQGSRAQLRDRYMCRWRRAAIKHRMPEILSELLCAHLLKKYDD